MDEILKKELQKINKELESGNNSEHHHFYLLGKKHVIEKISRKTKWTKKQRLN